MKPVLTRHVSAIVEPDKVGDLMRAIDGYHGQLVTRTALWLSAMLFQRPGNIRQMEWGELDLDGGMWTIPSDKMKRTKREKLNGRPHLVPLAPQAVAGLKDLHPLTGRGRYVFPALEKQNGEPRQIGILNADRITESCFFANACPAPAGLGSS